MRYLGRVQSEVDLVNLCFFLHFQHSTSSISSYLRQASIESRSVRGSSQEQGEYEEQLQDEREQEEYELDLAQRGNDRLEYLSIEHFSCPYGHRNVFIISPQNKSTILLFSILFMSYMKLSQFLLLESSILQIKESLLLVGLSQFYLKKSSIIQIKNQCPSCCYHPLTIYILSYNASFSFLQSRLYLLSLRLQKRLVIYWAFVFMGKSALLIIWKRTWRTDEMQQVFVRFYRPLGQLFFDGLRPQLLLEGERSRGERQRLELQWAPYVELLVQLCIVSLRLLIKLTNIRAYTIKAQAQLIFALSCLYVKLHCSLLEHIITSKINFICHSKQLLHELSLGSFTTLSLQASVLRRANH